MADIKKILQDRILVLDGAMGTMIQGYNLSEEDFRNEAVAHISKSIQGNNDFLSVTRPDVIKEIHQAYLDVGADIIETNTFCANSISQDDYDMATQVYAINYESARIAKETAQEYTAANPDKPRFVAGSIGPTNKTASMSPDVNDPGYRAVSFDDLRISYVEQVTALIAGGVDLLLIETIFDTLNAKAAIFAAQEVMEQKGIDIPIMISGTITDASGRTLSGQTAEAFLVSVAHAQPLSVGFNCALGADQLRPYLQVLSDRATCHVSAHPNAGLPNEFGEYDQTPELMADLIKTYLDLGLVNIIGGCCGTSPAHIKAIADLVKQYTPKEKVVLA